VGGGGVTAGTTVAATQPPLVAWGNGGHRRRNRLRHWRRQRRRWRSAAPAMPPAVDLLGWCVRHVRGRRVAKRSRRAAAADRIERGAAVEHTWRYNAAADTAAAAATRGEPALMRRRERLPPNPPGCPLPDRCGVMSCGVGGGGGGGWPLHRGGGWGPARPVGAASVPHATEWSAATPSRGQAGWRVGGRRRAAPPPACGAVGGWRPLPPPPRPPRQPPSASAADGSRPEGCRRSGRGRHMGPPGVRTDPPAGGKPRGGVGPAADARRAHRYTP